MANGRGASQNASVIEKIGKTLVGWAGTPPPDPPREAQRPIFWVFGEVSGIFRNFRGFFGFKHDWGTGFSLIQLK